MIRLLGHGWAMGLQACHYAGVETAFLLPGQRLPTC
jgi:hypothetical protein